MDGGVAIVSGNIEDRGQLRLWREGGMCQEGNVCFYDLFGHVKEDRADAIHSRVYVIYLCVRACAITCGLIG